MKAVTATVAFTLALIAAACLDESSTGPTPLVNTQLHQLQTQIEELEHQLAACYAGHEIERGEEDKYLPPRNSAPGTPAGQR